MTNSMYQYDSYNPAYSLPTEFPSLPPYRELLEARQRRLEEKTKSAGVLAALKTFESPSGTQLPPMRPRYQQPAILKKLNYDFGTLKEFLNYDLKLKKPEELFKMPEKGKKVEVKNKEEDLKKGLMQHMRQDIDNRDAKTILLEEKDPEKVGKAAKKFISDMMGDVFKDDLIQLEKKIAQKGIGKLHELIMDLEEDNPIRKIAEKYGYKSLADKFNILEAEMEKKKNPETQFQLANLKKPRLGGIPTKAIMQGFGSNGQGEPAMHSPMENHKQPGLKSPGVHAPKHTVQFGNNNPNNLSVNRDKPYMLIDEDAVTYAPARHHTSTSPKLKKKEVSDAEQVAYAVRILSNSSSLKRVFEEYENGDKEQYGKESKQIQEMEKTKQDLYATKENEKYTSMSSDHLVVQYAGYKPHFFVHACLKVINFQSLQVFNVKGCNLSEAIIWFMLMMIEKYSHDIKMIDISENQVSPRVCEVIQSILVKHELRILKMASVDLDSKGLAVICLGLAKNYSVVSIDFNYNDINEYGFQTLALILRHTKTLQSVKILRKKVKVVMPNGEEKEVEEELGYTAMAAITKAFKYNKSINPKNVQLFEAKPN